MSRSYKKAPVSKRGVVASKKLVKKTTNQAKRSHFTTRVHSAQDLEAVQFDERNIAHSQRGSFANESVKWVGAQVVRLGRAIRVLANSPLVKTERDAHTLLGK